MKKWGTLVVLSLAQFVFVLNTSVMNVAVSQLIQDFDTNVLQIQSAITYFALVMAALVLTGAKLGDVWGRRRAFAIGIVVFGAGSLLTAVSWSTSIFILGWSLFQGIGAALYAPAIPALIAGSYKGADRGIAFGLLGAIAGAGIAAGPIVGGWVIDSLSWRVIFIGMFVAALIILVALRWVKDTPQPEHKPSVDWVGAALSAGGLALIVYGALQSSQWGIILPKNSPIEPFGLALTPFVICAGIPLLYLFVRWQRHREAIGKDPLVRLRLFKNKPFRSGISFALAQHMILAGAFFAFPVYLQLTLGFDALQTGLRLLPVSIATLVTSLGGTALMLRYSPRLIVRIGLIILLIGIGILLLIIQPTLDGFGFGLSMTLFGIGIGILSAILGNLIQSAVGERDRSEAGGLQVSANQVGIALGTAIIGSIVLSGLASSFITQVASDERIEPHISEAVEVSLASGVTFIQSSEVRAILESDDVEPVLVDPLIENYEIAQLDALRIALFAIAVIVIVALLFTRQLPTKRVGEIAEEVARTEASDHDYAGQSVDAPDTATEEPPTPG
jgi:MFS family permease